MRRSVLITGCTTGGAGHVLAKEYQACGMFTTTLPKFIDDKMVLVGLLVFATARRLESMEGLASLPGIVSIQLDVTQEASIREALRQVESHLDKENESRDPDASEMNPGMDILINNAGITTTLPFADTPISVSQQIIETNVITPMNVTKVFLAPFK
jgi:1-acylglycerone phosphate reductase